MMSVLEMEKTEVQELLRKKGVTVVEFGAEWCAPCKRLLPILEELSLENGPEVAVVKVDVDQSPDLAADYGIMSMPTVLVFKDGEAVDKLVGLRPKPVYQTIIDRLIEQG